MLGRVSKIASLLIGLFNAAVSIREWSSRPDRDIWIEEIGGFVSLHSIYMGIFVVGVAMILFSAWHKIVMILSVPEKIRQKKKRESDRNRAALVEWIDLLTIIIPGSQFPVYSIPNISPENQSNIEIAIGELRKFGLYPNEKLSGYQAMEYLTGMKPYLASHDIESAKQKIKMKHPQYTFQDQN